MSGRRSRAVLRGGTGAAMTALLTAVLAAPAVAAPAEPPSAPLGAQALERVETSTAAAALAAPVVPAPVASYTGAPEELGRYVPQISCDPVERTGTKALRGLLARTYGANSGGITRACSSSTTEHSEGRAYDWMRDAEDPADVADVQAFLGWLVGPDADGVAAGNARRLGVMYVIWDRKIWGSYNQTWKAYTGASPHRDHVHISLTWDGAMGRTSFWKGRTISGQDYGPCRRYVGEPVPTYTTRNPAPCPAPTTRPPTPPPPAPVAPAAGTALLGDWDGDGGAQLGVVRDGVVSLRLSPTRTVTYRFGRPDDVPVVGDWDGDGKDSVGLFRAGRWFLRDELSAGAPQTSLSYGSASARPVVGDWDGDGRDSVGVVVPDGRWLLRDSAGGGPSERALRYARPSDAPVAGDWDGDGDDEPGVRRGRQVFLRKDLAARPLVRELTFGDVGDQGVAGDFDRDGADTPGVRRGSLFAWRDDLLGGAATASLRFDAAG